MTLLKQKIDEYHASLPFYKKICPHYRLKNLESSYYLYQDNEKPILVDKYDLLAGIYLFSNVEKTKTVYQNIINQCIEKNKNFIFINNIFNSEEIKIFIQDNNKKVYIDNYDFSGYPVISWDSSFIFNLNTGKINNINPAIAISNETDMTEYLLKYIYSFLENANEKNKLKNKKIENLILYPYIKNYEEISELKKINNYAISSIMSFSLGLEKENTLSTCKKIFLK